MSLLGHCLFYLLLLSSAMAFYWSTYSNALLLLCNDTVQFIRMTLSQIKMKFSHAPKLLYAFQRWTHVSQCAPGVPPLFFSRVLLGLLRSSIRQHEIPIWPSDTFCSYIVCHILHTDIPTPRMCQISCSWLSITEIRFPAKCEFDEVLCQRFCLIKCRLHSRHFIMAQFLQLYT
jgi:hypothetical protein